MQPDKNKNPPDETHKDKKTWEAKVHDFLTGIFKYLIFMTPLLLAAVIVWPPAALFCLLLVVYLQMIATADDEDNKKK